MQAFKSISIHYAWPVYLPKNCVPDIKSASFAEECRRQSGLVAKSGFTVNNILQFRDEPLADAHTIWGHTRFGVRSPILRKMGDLTPAKSLVDKVVTVERDKLGLAFGRAGAVVEVERCLTVLLSSSN